MAEEIQVLFFASARAAAGCGQARIVCHGEGMSEEEFWTALGREFPKVGALQSVVRLARNHEYLESGGRIHPGDEVALIPPVSGG